MKPPLPWRRVAVLSLVVGLVAAVLTPIYWSRLASPEKLKWTVVGAGGDGRSLDIITTAEGGSCQNGDLPQARLERDAADEIRIRVVQHQPVSWEDALSPTRSYACAGVGIGRSRFTVQLEHPLAGQRIAGPGYRSELATKVGRWSYDSDAPRTLGRVVGLRLEDARRVLRSYGIARTKVDGSADSGAVVTAQNPEPGSILPPRPGVSRRTFDPRLAAQLTTRR